METVAHIVKSENKPDCCDEGPVNACDPTMMLLELWFGAGSVQGVLDT